MTGKDPRSTGFRRRPERLLWVVALGIVVLAGGCRTTYRGPTPYVRRHVLDVPFENRIPTSLIVHLHHGGVLVRPGRELAGRLSVDVSAATQEEAIRLSDQVRVELAEESRFVTRLGATHPRGADLDAVYVSFELVVPPHVRLRVRAVRAEVRLLGYRGEADVSNARGMTEARLGGGRCSLSTDSGVLRLSGRYRAARLESREGPVRIALPDRPDRVRLDVRTGSGPVTLLAPSTCRLDVEFSSRSGRVRCSLPAVWQSDGTRGPDRRRWWRGVVGPTGARGCAHCRVRSDSGPFEILEVRALPASGPRSSRRPKT